MDNVSSASIDVITTGASPYGETRTEYSVGADYLYDKSIVGVGYTNSDERLPVEYRLLQCPARISSAISTLSFGYSQGRDDVYQNGNPDFAGNIDRYNYRLGLSQVVTPSLVVGLNYEMVTEGLSQ